MTTDRPVLVACAHGTRAVAGRRAVGALVAAVAEAAGPEVEVRAAYVDVQPPSVPEALAGLAGRRVAVVPLLLSAGYHVHVDLTEAVTARADDRITLRPALGPDDRIVALLARRLAEVGLAEDDAVVLSSAGSSDPRAVADCEQVAAGLAARLGRPVSSGFLSAASPTTAEAVAAAREPHRRVVVANHLLAPGFFAGLASRSGADLVTAPLLGTPAPGDVVPPELVELVLARSGLAG